MCGGSLPVRVDLRGFDQAGKDLIDEAFASGGWDEVSGWKECGDSAGSI